MDDQAEPIKCCQPLLRGPRLCHYFVNDDFGGGVSFVGGEVESPGGTDSFC